MSLCVELEDAVSGLRDATRGAYDAILCVGSLQRRDIHAVDVDRSNVDGLSRGTEVRAAQDESSASDVGGSYCDTGVADRQNASGTSASGRGRAEGIDLEVTAAAADIVHHQAIERVVTEQVQSAACAVQRYHVARSNRARSVQGQGGIVNRYAIRWDCARGGHVEDTTVDDGAAAIGIRRCEGRGAGAGFYQRDSRAGDHRVERWNAGALRVDEQLGPTGGDVTLADDSADVP